jgi:hypothetical protein
MADTFGVFPQGEETDRAYMHVLLFWAIAKFDEWAGPVRRASLSELWQF